ncbi:MAG: excinuclease ABC subunit UvrA, partial [Chrysiogenetes bacterium]|nr:excinuclease ABC subunit UvrA [Chrysiogenetes bacterium]
QRALVLFPPHGDELKDPERFLDSCRRRAYIRVWIDGETLDVDEVDPDAVREADSVFIVADRLVLRESDRARLSTAVENAFREGRGEMAVYPLDAAEVYGFCEEFSSPATGRIFEEPTPALFSFNSPLGACGHCKGFGNVLQYDERKIIPNPSLSLAKGAIEPWTKPSMRENNRVMLRWAIKEGIDTEKPWKDLSKAVRQRILQGDDSFEGVFPFFTAAERKKYKVHVRVFLRRYQSDFPCPACDGKRLRPEALLVKVGGKDISEICNLSIGDLAQFFEELKLSRAEQDTAREVLRQVRARLTFLNEVGLNYLALSRLAKTLSGGEHQRINLANQLGAALVGTLYVLDEPSIGLHARDISRLMGTVRRITDTGNTVVVVEHDPAMIRAGDHLIELGPGSGHRGGEIVYQGGVDQLVAEGLTATAEYLRGQLNFPDAQGRRQNKGWLRLTGARENNLKSTELKIPLGNFVAVSGVSGSGKSTLITKTLYPALDRLFGTGTASIGRFDMISGFEGLHGVSLIDQTPIGRSSRSNPITYMKAWDEIRLFYSELPESLRRRFKPKHFSFNTDGGRCPACQGEGVIHVEMHFLADMEVTCEVCDGRRFKPEVLAVKYRGKSIDEVLQLTVTEAKTFFPPLTKLKNRLGLLEEVGLGYMRLGQSSNTISGGEAQRLKVAAELGRRDGKKILYLLDEPTTGLHGADVAKLLRVLDRLVTRGNTVLVIEHNLDVLARADWLIDLGPEGGDGGGQIVAAGPPEEVSRVKQSHTGHYLKEYFDAGARAARPH